jgi:hypothetical protein
VFKLPATVSTRRAMLVAAAATLLTSCGGGGGSTDTTGNPPANSQAIVRLTLNPTGYYFASSIAVGPADTLFVANPARSNIFKLTQDGVISDFAGKDGVAPGTDGPGNAAGFSGNFGQLLFDKKSQLLYVVDGGSTLGAAPVSLRRITTSGVTSTMALSTFPTHAPAGSPLPTNYGDHPTALALGADGILYASTAYNLDRNSGSPHNAKYVALQLGWRTIDSNGGGRELFHQESGWVTPATDNPFPYFPVDYKYPADMSATAGMLSSNLFGLAVDRAGNGYIADANRHIIVKITPAGAASIFAGAADKPGTADGAGTAAQFHTPVAMVIDKADNLYVVDHDNDTIRKITPSGTVSTVVGVPGLAETRTGALPGGLKNPVGLAIDDSGRLYVTVPDGVLRIQLP